MIKKVPVSHLRIGVFVEKIEQSWFSTPFLFNKFKISSEGQIQKLKEYEIQEVYIDTDKGLDAVAPQDQEEESPRQGPPTEYFQVPTEKLVVDTMIPFDVFILNDKEYTLHLRRGLPYHSVVHAYLENHDIKSVYIHPADRPLLDKYERDTSVEKELSKKGLAAGFESKEKIERYNDYLDNYMPIEASFLLPGVRAPVDIYSEQDTRVTVVLPKDTRVPEDELFCGKDPTVRRNFLIHLKDRDLYKNFLRELASGKMQGTPEQAAKVRAAVVKENSKIVTKELMENPRSGEAVKEAKNVVSDMITTILENPSSFYGLMKINTYDYYTYLHSINVCTLSIGLAMSMNMEKTLLTSLAVGSLMHDVGKSQVSSQLINKPGRMTDQEFAQVKNHVLLGSNILKEHQDLSKKSLIPVLQHHEKLNGMGYPNKLQGDEIHIFGRISSIVDVYDALTTERAYKKAFRPFDAVNLLAKNKDEYDQHVFKYFVTMLGKQIT